MNVRRDWYWYSLEWISYILYHISSFCDIIWAELVFFLGTRLIVKYIGHWYNVVVNFSKFPCRVGANVRIVTGKTYTVCLNDMRPSKSSTFKKWHFKLLPEKDLWYAWTKIVPQKKIVRIILYRKRLLLLRQASVPRNCAHFKFVPHYIKHDEYEYRYSVRVLSTFFTRVYCTGIYVQVRTVLVP